MAVWREGQDGQQTIYSERLWPGPGLMLISVVVIAPVAIAYGAAFGGTLGWILGVLLIGLAWAWLLGSAPVIRVDERVFRAGRARLPREYVGTVSELDRDELARERTGGDVRTFLALRPGTSRRAVLVEVCDPQDPHPRWIVQTRHPQKVISALSMPPNTKGE